MSKLVDPVIVVPGITASSLKDEYDIDHDKVWGVIRKNYERVVLHPDNFKYEATEPARIRPSEIFEIAYKELIEELRYNLKEKEEEVVPVYPFAYDWRMPLEIIEEEFDKFIEEVVERTKLMRHYAENGYANDPKVNLVGHSMGGLVITGYLIRKSAKTKDKQVPVNKVITLATPFQGSFESVMKITTGNAELGAKQGNSRERETARLTPALYYLLPMFQKGINVEDGIPDSLFNPASWQTSIIDSISEFIRLKGLPTPNHKNKAQKIFKSLLKNAESHGKAITKFNLTDVGLDEKKWMAVVGVNSKTRVKLNIVTRNGEVDFDIRSDDRDNQWENANPEKRRLTGDGTVPYEGAIPPFLKEENLICVTTDDYGYWEFSDKAFSKIAGFHGILPNMNLIHRLIVRFLKEQDDTRGNTWGKRAPGVQDWNPPLDLKEG
ncbi:lipase/acyltransferase domain-containing protein [Maribellus mangrovi]|uniref:lipase/acyltransferase domain-containing protein n=1 Tax=Maribellus mangrovi TaxID=3133146 RepID=UPI0030EE7942